MTAIIAALVLPAVVISVDYVTPAIREWLRRREVVRRSVVDQQMQAMRAAQQLSLVAWKAPDDLDQPSGATKRALEQVHGHGLVPVKAAAPVTYPVILGLGPLSVEEALLVERTPHAAARVKAIVDAFTADAVARMGYQS